MREIIFRGKRVDNDEWVYGSFIPDLLEVFEKVKNMDGFIKPFGKTKEERMMVEVDRKTVGQYTGLTDKNGVKIFEGDICDFTVFDFQDCDKQYRGVVVYDGTRFSLWKTDDCEFYGADGGFDLDWVVNQDAEFSIIGNIHDNHEILEVET